MTIKKTVQPAKKPTKTKPFDSKAHVEKIEAALESVGIKSSYDDYDMDDEDIVIELDRERRTFLWTGSLNKVKNISVIATSKKHRQVLINLVEEGRTAQHATVGVTNKMFDKGLSQTNLKKIHSTHGYNMPAGTVYSLVDLATGQELKKLPLSGSVRVRAKAPPSNQIFLVGYDEKHLFISLLPDTVKVKTVEQAHQALVPKECRGRECLRQGEFFFLPVAKDKLNEKFWGRLEASMEFFLEKEDGQESDHQASIHFKDAAGKQYALGNVTADRHKTLTLNRLHEVFVNNEVPGESDSWD